MEKRMNKVLKSLLAAGMVVSLAACASESAPEESVAPKSSAEATMDVLERQTQYGAVKGIEDNGVQIYYGIPYGKEAVGDLRWKNTEAPDAWTDVLDCTQKEDMALQLYTQRDADGNATTSLSGTTDCLNLDVYTTGDAEKKPVIVYFHGGNNQSGSSFEIAGDEIVRQDDAVYVSVNYRLNLLGFNCLPALTKDGQSGNFAMYDMAESLKWVRNNIENFGGDAQNVTVSGFSAGGRDVMAMLVSPLFEGLFDKALVYSGGMTIADEDASARQIAYMMAPLAVEDGKAEDEATAVEYLMGDSDEVRDYLYSLEEGRIISLAGDAGIRMALFPHLYGDDIVLPSTGFENAKYVNDVPVLMLTGETEFSLFGSFDGYLFSLPEEEQNTARSWVVKYGSDFYRTFNTQLSAEKMAEDSYKSNMYLLQVNYGGADSATMIPMFGSFHGIFVPMYTMQNGYNSFTDFTAAGYRKMAEIYNGYVKNFVATGDPNGADAPVEWPAWTLENKSTLVLDADETSGEASAVVEDVYKTNAQIIEEMEADDSVSEEVKANLIRIILNGRWFSKDLDEHFENPTLWK